MTSVELDIIAPLDTPLPPIPEGGVLTPSQWTTFLAIADTIVPAVEASSTHSVSKLAVQPSEFTTAVQRIQQLIPADVPSEAVQRYMGDKASLTPGFKDLLHRTFGNYMREDALKGLRVILSSLECVSMRTYCLLECGG